MEGCLDVIPFVDCINHHNVDSSYEMIKADWKPLSLNERLMRFKEPAEEAEEGIVDTGGPEAGTAGVEAKEDRYYNSV